MADALIIHNNIMPDNAKFLLHKMCALRNHTVSFLKKTYEVIFSKVQLKGTSN